MSDLTHLVSSTDTMSWCSRHGNNTVSTHLGSSANLLHKEASTGLRENTQEGVGGLWVAIEPRLGPAQGGTAPSLHHV